MKYIFLVIFTFFILAISFGQVDSLPHGVPSPKSNTRAEYAYVHNDSGFINAIRDTLWQPRFRGTEVLWYHSGVDTAKWIYIGAAIGRKWVKAGSSSGSSGGSSNIIGGKAISHLPAIGDVAPSNVSPDSMFNYLYYQSQNPIATLSGGTTIELTSASTVAQTLSWSASRQTATNPISTIVVASINQSFSNPSAPGTVNGTQNVNVTSNATTTYNNIVTTTDGKSATASTTFSFIGKKYYGLISDTTGITTGALNSNIITLNPTFATSRALTTNNGPVTGTKFWVYAYPATLGNLTALSFNSIPALAAMNIITIPVTNASGYTQSYIIYYNKQGQTTASDIIAQ